MPSFLALVSTFSAGLVSFVAPCTLPLVPAYLAYAGGLAGMDLNDAATRDRARGRLLAGTLLFVLGFAIVFVLLGIAAGGIGHAVHAWGTGVQVVGGLLLVVFGLTLAGVLRLPGADCNYRFEVPERMRGLGLAAALPFGVIFGIGWTPCVGPFLGAALSLAAVSSEALQGAILLAAYALGLGLPFVVVALLWASYPGVARGLGRFGAASSRVAGLVIAALGVAVATGLYSHVTSFLAQYSL
ncbi:MAG TPA: cytochrome c biogenesis protein CcdA [Candidatus Dormibacteraeota bacterium]|nr:cytochrome c biogenesis protein CcdA [Candidatus Dormibacteraeota bacterium]